MCGICGIFRPDGGLVDAARVAAMRDVMAMRGPDGQGLHHGPGFALGHRRLSIIDLSDAGCQPMANEDGTVQLVFNGEIYNFTEMRPALEAAGHHFHSRTDSEVLVHGYEEWGIEGLLRRIRGMFAFAIVDSARGELHLARDPLGKKPLFFRHIDGELVFASSARALAKALPPTPCVDLTAVHDLLWHLYIPGPRTIFEGVEKLPPGHALTLGQGGVRRDFAHWQPDFLHPEHGVDDEEWLSRIESALTQAIRRRLVADVPVGVLLSGGVDSGLVTALAARVAGPIKTFSVTTQDPTLDESVYARAIAERYATEHHALPVRGDVRDGLPQLVAAMGEPLGDASAANLFAIAQLARQSVTVVLTGDGGDEGFGGYSHYGAYYQAGRWQSRLPAPLLPPLEALGHRLGRGRGLVRRAGTFLRLTGAPVQKSFPAGARNLKEEIRTALFTAEAWEVLRQHDATAHYAAAINATSGARAPIVDRVMQAQMQTLLPDDYCTKVDVATMAVSLEARCPFLDVDVIELAMKIPAAARFRGGEPKSLLRHLARRLLPVETVDRRKMGFRAPVGHWLRHDWPDLVDDLILGPHVEERHWFRRDTLQRLVTEQRQGVNHDYLLWNLLILEMWLRQTEGGWGRS